MINSNKILTVSYGTFSCTLEGFDDSFGTMKAIAEYFRDLAADDRYFGAEPPQPDAQMLARIAQREISRHVDARQDDGRIVLSARNTPQSAAAVASDVVEDVASAVAEATETKAELTVEDVATPAQADAPEKAQAADEAAAPDEAEAPPPVEKAEAEAPEVVRKSQLRITPPAPAQAEDKPDIIPSLPDAEVEAFFTDHKESKPVAKPVPVAEFEDESAATGDAAKASSIADKLKRIRAVVSQQAEDAAAKDYSEDQHVEADAAKAETIAQTAAAESPEMEDFAEEDEAISPDDQSDVLADTLRDIEDAMDADDAEEITADADDEIDTDEIDIEDDNDDIAAILNRLEREADATGVAAAPLAAEADEDDSDDDEMDGNILAVMDSTDAAEDADEDNMFDTEDEQAADNAPKAAVLPAVAAPRTRVLKVKRATLEAAIQSGMLEEYTDEEEGDATPAPQPLRKAPLAERSTLSAEAEADLARELAELEADIAAKSKAPDAKETAHEPAQTQSVAPHAAPKSEMRAAPDADVSRLMEETAQQMEEPEAATRRDAFTHLRAAVAAKKADEAVGGTETEVDTGEAYRDDLDQVVRPRRPVSSGRARSERPAEQRPAPLKLVAEQRIDVSEPRSVAPVRPRRVAAVAPAPAPAASASDATSFEDFASEMGAVQLTDLLEAAAAYLSFVEGHEQFSRPQLMNKVRQVELDNFTREDSLRSFGKLLREGKIEKLKGGRFQASDQIGFKPDARAAG